MYRENNHVVYKSIHFDVWFNMSTINKKYRTDQISKERFFAIVLREFFKVSKLYCWSRNIYWSSK